MTKTGKVSRLMTHIPSPVLEMNPIDAYKAEIETDDIVTVSSKNGTVRVKVKVANTTRESVVFFTHALGQTIG